jgi:hypothetical protein
MTALFNIIKENCKEKADAEDWDGVLAHLENPTNGVKDSTLRTSRWLMDTFDAVLDPNTGATEADLILGTLEASSVPRVKAALASMSSEGIDLSNDQVQGMIEKMAEAGNWSSDLKDRLKAFGVSSQTLAESSGVNPIDASVCEDHWNAGIAVENGTAEFTDKRVLFSLNSNPKSTSYSLRRIPVGVINGVPIKGKPIAIGGVKSAAAGKELTLINEVQAAIAKYLGE